MLFLKIMGAISLIYIVFLTINTNAVWLVKMSPWSINIDFTNVKSLILKHFFLFKLILAASCFLAYKGYQSVVYTKNKCTNMYNNYMGYLEQKKQRKILSQNLENDAPTTLQNTSIATLTLCTNLTEKAAKSLKNMANDYIAFGPKKTQLTKYIYILSYTLGTVMLLSILLTIYYVYRF